MAQALNFYLGSRGTVPVRYDFSEQYRDRSYRRPLLRLAHGHCSIPRQPLLEEQPSTRLHFCFVRTPCGISPRIGD